CVAVPRADDLYLVIGEPLAAIGAAGIDDFDHARHADSLAGRPALVGTQVAIGEQLAALAQDGQFDAAHLLDARIAVGKLLRRTDPDLGHWLLLHRDSIL